MDKSTHPIMLVISTTRQSPTTITHALERAETTNEPLHVLFILDSEVPNSIFDNLTEMGFVGERPSQQLTDAIIREYRDLGGAKITEVEKLANERKLPVTTELLEGDFLSTCINRINCLGVGEVILTRRKRGNISRYLFGSAVKDLAEKACCPVTIIDED